MRRHWTAWALIGPGGVFVLCFLVYPAIEVVLLALHHQTGRGIYQREFVGLANFSQLMHDADVFATFGRTGLWVGGVTAGSYLAGLGIALLLNRPFPGRSIIRSAILAPWAVPFVATAFIWKQIYDGQYGVLNHIVVSLGLVEKPVSWLGSPDWALASVILVGIWKQLPFVVITLLAALQSVSSDHYEAAALDGAGRWLSFRHVTWPALAPISATVILFVAIWNYNTFDLIYLMTGGGPAKSSQIISILTYLSTFTFNEINYAAAIGVAGLLVMALAIVPVARLVAKNER